MHIFRNACLILLVLALATQPAAADLLPDWQAKVDPLLLGVDDDEPVEFLVFLHEQADLANLAIQGSKAAKGAIVYERLNTLAKRSQVSIRHQLDYLGVDYQPYWIANVLWVRADPSLIANMARRADVAHIYANPAVKLDQPEMLATKNLATLQPQGVEWNIEMVGAPEVWAAGFTGQGAVVGGQDTGYDWTHPALKNSYLGWDGSQVDHNYVWHDAIHSDINGNGTNPCGFNLQAPCDDYGHGTHTMGTMVGDDGAGNQVGMAPGARWIACRNMEQGYGKPSTYIECYEWFVAPTDLNGANPRPDLAPDVINNSWNCPVSEGCTSPNILLEVVQNVRQAGIVTVHSAGNSGALGCSSISTPAAIYDESFTVGATNSSDKIAGFSSRGPVQADGSGRLKPNVSAPGDGVRSSILNNTFGWASGTSMAAPHVAGLVALMISASPALHGQVSLIEEIIQDTAQPRPSDQTCGDVPGTQVPNNTYGWGRVDAWAAIQGITHQFLLTKQANLLSIFPGQQLTYTLNIFHSHPFDETTNIILQDTLPINTSFFSATGPYTLDGNIVRWEFPSLGSNASQSVSLTVEVLPGSTSMLENLVYEVSSDQVPIPITGIPISTPVGWSIMLPVVMK